MSEPMTNIEIEDVLSSIRRLVSEDFRAPAADRGRGDKLVLTPALRVVSHNPTVPVPSVDADAITGEAAAALLETALSGTAGDWEPDGSEMTARDWSVEWDRERDRMVRLHLHPAAEKPTDEASAVDEPPAAAAAPTVEDNAGLLIDDAVAASPGLQHDTASQDDSGPEQDDQDDLRDMVREIIREELQGDLGERITRSVRKLVRAEINRALAARDIG